MVGFFQKKPTKYNKLFQEKIKLFRKDLLPASLAKIFSFDRGLADES